MSKSTLISNITPVDKAINMVEAASGTHKIGHDFQKLFAQNMVGQLAGYLAANTAFSDSVIESLVFFSFKY